MGDIRATKTEEIVKTIESNINVMDKIHQNVNDILYLQNTNLTQDEINDFIRTKIDFFKQKSDEIRECQEIIKMNKKRKVKKI